MKTSLYRHFDKDGTLLYVGISLSALNRLGQHADHSAWFETISNVTIEHFETREEALRAETMVIREEKPLHNIQKKKQIYKEERSQESKQDLTAKIVRFNPIYMPYEVCEILDIGGGTFNKIIEDGTLGHILIPPKPGLSAHGTPFKPKLAVTGWQLIDYIEYLEKQSAA